MNQTSDFATDMSPERPKLLVVTKAFWPVIGGVEESARRLALAAAQRYDVTVLAVSETRQSNTEQHNGISVVKTRKLAKVFSSPVSLGFHPAYARLAPEADIIHVHSPWPPGELSLVLKPTSARVVTTYHFDIVKQRAVGPVYRPLLNAALRRSDCIVCSNPNLQATSSYLAPHHAKTCVIPFGIDYDKYALRPEEQESVNSIRKAHCRPIVLFVGRMVYYKGVEYLIRAATMADIDVVLVGSGPLDDQLKELAQSLGIANRVFFLGALSDSELRPYYHACDVFVLPSVARSEAFGLVLLEAMCAGKPLVTTELGTGTSWVNRHGETGLVVPPRDESALAAAITRITGNQDMAIRMGHSGMIRVKEVFSIEKYAGAYLELLDSLLSRQVG